MNFILKLIIGIIFLFIITPVGLILRLFGVDYLDEKKDSSRTSFWKNHS